MISHDIREIKDALIQNFHSRPSTDQHLEHGRGPQRQPHDQERL